MSYTSNDTTRTGFPMLDMMMKMQHLGFQAMRLYQPFAMAALNTAARPEQTVYPTGPAAFKPMAPQAYRPSAPAAFTSTTGGATVAPEQEQVVPLGEEVLNIGTRMVQGKTTRVRRVVVETPVQQDVTLHTETVMVERRKPLSSSGENMLTEVTVELSDYNEVPVVTKDVRVVEEVLLRREVTARTETIRDTVKHDTIEVEQPSQLPVVFTATAADRAQDAKARDAKAQDAKGQDVKAHEDRKPENGQARKTPPGVPGSAQR